MTDATRLKWTRRVEEWRASGEEAAEFAKREGEFTGGTLRYWASKLKREPPGVTARDSREVRLARVVRLARPDADGQGAVITIDVMSTSIRVGVAVGADRATLAMVLEVLRAGSAR
jgi:hypothetical protein